MFFLKYFQMWNKDDHARQLLTEREGQIKIPANDKEQNKTQVSGTRGLYSL